MSNRKKLSRIFEPYPATINGIIGGGRMVNALIWLFLSGLWMLIYIWWRWSFMDNYLYDDPGFWSIRLWSESLSGMNLFYIALGSAVILYYIVIGVIGGSSEV